MASRVFSGQIIAVTEEDLVQRRPIDTPRKSMPVNQVCLLSTDDLGVSVKCEGCGCGWPGRWVDDGG